MKAARRRGNGSSPNEQRASIPIGRDRSTNKKGASGAAPFFKDEKRSSDLDNRYDFQSLGIDDQELIADQHIFVTLIFRHVLHEILWHVLNRVAPRHVSADENREARAGDPMKVMTVNEITNAQPLIARQFNCSRALAGFAEAKLLIVLLHYPLLKILLFYKGAVDLALLRNRPVDVFLRMECLLRYNISLPIDLNVAAAVHFVAPCNIAAVDPRLALGAYLPLRRSHVTLRVNSGATARRANLRLRRGGLHHRLAGFLRKNHGRRRGDRHSKHNTLE